MAKKKLGQHFLIDKNIAAREIKYASLQKDDIVLEIGPGKGILTKLLSEKAKQVIALEIDDKLVKRLRSWIPDNVQLIQGDALKIDFDKLPRFNKIVSNLPFQISSPITFKFFNYGFSKAILIYQKDFAKRMVALPGVKDYSRLSVAVYFKSYCRLLETVPKTCFSPQPKIDSCIVELISREKPPFSVADEKFFFEVVKKLFNYRRKKIRNILKETYNINVTDLPYIDMRVEEITPKQIAELSNSLFNIV